MVTVVAYLKGRGSISKSIAAKNYREPIVLAFFSVNNMLKMGVGFILVP